MGGGEEKVGSSTPNFPSFCNYHSYQKNIVKIGLKNRIVVYAVLLHKFGCI